MVSYNEEYIALIAPSKIFCRQRRHLFPISGVRKVPLFAAFPLLRAPWFLRLVPELRVTYTHGHVRIYSIDPYLKSSKFTDHWSPKESGCEFHSISMHCTEMVYCHFCAILVFFYEITICLDFQRKSNCWVLRYIGWNLTVCDLQLVCAKFAWLCGTSRKRTLFNAI